MAYTRPVGNAAGFKATGTLRYPVVPTMLGFKQGGSYTPPVGNAILAQFTADTLVDWSRPLSTAVNFATVDSQICQGTGSVVVAFPVVGTGTHIPPNVVGTADAVVLFTPTGVANHGVTGSAAVTAEFTPTGTGKVGVKGSGAVELAFAPAGVATHIRYEVRGEIRQQGVLVDRMVRVYRRDTGALVGEAQSVGGYFKVTCGFAAREHYIVPVHLDDLAEDFSPPVANRVLSVMAQDAA